MHEPYGWTPIWWAKFRAFRWLAAGPFRLSKRPILVLSLPRSGSSWIGSILGESSTTLYMREPLTQVVLRQFGMLKSAENEIREPAILDTIDECAGYVFRGLPVFSKNVVMAKGRQDSRDWAISRRRGKRLVVKEVNPLYLEPILENFDPFVLFIYRHPAAVAESFSRLGWIRNTTFKRTDFSESVVSGISSDSLDWIETINDYWIVNGFRQGMHLNHIRKILARGVDYTTVIYEELCQSPLAEFRRIFDACEIDWTSELELLISDTTTKTSKGDYSRHRVSAELVDEWRSKVPPGDVAKIRSGFDAAAPGIYSDDSFW